MRQETRGLALTVVLVAGIVAMAASACGGTRNDHYLPFDSEADGAGDGTGDWATDPSDDTAADTPWDGTGDPPADTGWDTGTDTGLDTGMDTYVDTTPEPYPDGTDLTDTDGDTIRDIDEGNGTVDTDGDGSPDSQDLDSDHDGIPDSMEAGDTSAATPPIDSDFDGTPDYRDLDSDDDTIRDSDEGVADVDGDGVPNYRDLDSDGDYLQDFFEAGDSDLGTGPYNHDGDSVPDYLDVDSDGDTISDLDESNIDTGSDGSYDYLTLDSDSDTIPDRDEAGDYDLATPPLNCDDDTLPNYRDTDSDNDGIADASEASYGTDRCNADTDGDGVTDLVEIAYGSSPLNPADSPRTHGDFVFEVPYNEAPTPTVDTLVFSTNLQLADVYFLVDTTGSMGGEISNLRTSIAGTLIPDIRTAIPDTWFGVGHFDDYPNYWCGYGDESSSDVVFRQLQQMTSSTSAAQTAANSIPLHYGVDDAESNIPALYHLVTGLAGPTYGPAAGPSCGAGYTGYACFRSEAVKIVVMISDAYFHNGPSGYNYDNGCLGITTPTYASTVAQCTSRNVKVIGVHSDSWSTDYDYRVLANATGAVDSGGSPLVYNIAASGSGLGSQIVNAVQTVATNVPIRVDSIMTDDTSDSVNTISAFVQQVHTNTSGGTVWDPVTSAWRTCNNRPTGAPGTPPSTDYFTSVLPGLSVCFDIFPKTNTTVTPLTTPQIFMATIDVIGDLYTPLDTRDVYFLVPPVIPGGN